jgi:PadR family transcriptional regulator PadR
MAFKGDLEALVLAVLNERDLHGYEISKQIKLRSGEVLKYGEGQLYPALHKLESELFIVAKWVPQEGKPDRKVYAITPEGTKELVRHQSAWRRFAESVSGIMGGKPSEAN